MILSNPIFCFTQLLNSSLPVIIKPKHPGCSHYAVPLSFNETKKFCMFFFYLILSQTLLLANPFIVACHLLVRGELLSVLLGENI